MRFDRGLSGRAMVTGDAGAGSEHSAEEGLVASALRDAAGDPVNWADISAAIKAMQGEPAAGRRLRQALKAAADREVSAILVDWFDIIADDGDASTA